MVSDSNWWSSRPVFWVFGGLEFGIWSSSMLEELWWPDDNQHIRTFFLGGITCGSRFFGREVWHKVLRCLGTQPTDLGLTCHCAGINFITAGWMSKGDGLMYDSRWLCCHVCHEVVEGRGSCVLVSTQHTSLDHYTLDQDHMLLLS